MKFCRGGIAPHFILEFIDKLRTSREFGEEVEYREGPQTLRVHVIKQNVYPIFIRPYFKRDTYAVAKKYHVELLPTWILSKCASEAIGKQVNVKTLFKQYMKKEGGPIDQFLKETFTK